MICLGDMVDFAAISRWGKDPRLSSALDEYARFLQHARKLYNYWPEADYIMGNHDNRPKNTALANGIPDYFLKDDKELMCMPEGWNVHESLILENSDGLDTLVHHGHGKNGDALKTALLEMRNFVCGHHHQRFGVQYHQSTHSSVWGMNCASLVDRKHLAFVYGKNFSKQPIIGTGIIVNNIPMVIPMRMDKHGRWAGRL